MDRSVLPKVNHNRQTKGYTFWSFSFDEGNSYFECTFHKWIQFLWFLLIFILLETSVSTLQIISSICSCYSDFKKTIAERWHFHYYAYIHQNHDANGMLVDNRRKRKRRGEKRARANEKLNRRIVGNGWHSLYLLASEQVPNRWNFKYTHTHTLLIRPTTWKTQLFLITFFWLHQIDTRSLLWRRSLFRIQNEINETKQQQ